MSLITFFLHHQGEIWQAVLEHVWLVGEIGRAHV